MSFVNVPECLPNQIFIVYEKHETELAGALKELFDHWRIGAFYCRQEVRGLGVSTPYRKFLADKLSASRLVIPLLSPSFQWSAYCQAEVGAAATRKKPMIPVIIPPLTEKVVNDISPVLEGLEAVIVFPNLAHWGAEQLVKHLKSTDNPDKWEAQTFIKTLRSKILQALNLETFWQESQDSNETRLRSNVEAALRWTIEDNLLYLPKREVLSIWPSIDINTESLAPASIIESIKRSLTNPDNPITRLHFVGVSLKFSLPLITEALQELADTHERGLTPVPTTRSGRKVIRLVIGFGWEQGVHREGRRVAKQYRTGRSFGMRG